MKTTGPVLAIFALLLAVVVAHAGDVPKLAGFEPLGEPAFYNSQDVWNAINGAAEVHMDYGFKELLIQKYKKGDREIELEVFDQGAGINAFGIFRRELPPSTTAVSIGGEAAIIEPYTCSMWKASYLVRVRASSGDLDASFCKSVLQSVAKSLKGKDGMPDELSSLPKHNRFKDSENYTPRGYMGITDLPNVLHAKYKAVGFETYELFQVRAKNADAVNNIWQKLKEKWKPIEHGGQAALYREIPYRGPVVTLKTKTGIWGVSTSGDHNVALEWLKKLIENPPRENVCSEQ